MKKADIIVGTEFEPFQCTEEPSTMDVSDVHVDAPGVYIPGQIWVKALPKLKLG